MIEITIPKNEVIDSETGIIYRAEKDWHLKMEHSLISIQKWEAKWHVAFLNQNHKRSFEETIDYLRCMTLTPNVPDEVFYCIPPEELKRVAAYIEDPMTATRISDAPGKPTGVRARKDVMTAEVIYYMMIALNIPSEYRKWHFNQLMTLIRVIEAKQGPKKKRRMKDVLTDYKAINEANKKRFNTKG